MTSGYYDNRSQFRSLPILAAKMWRDLRASNYLGYRLAVRNVSALYRLSALGYFWAFLPPLVSAGAFIMLKSGGVLEVKLPVPYPVWLVTGTFLWQSFADSISGQMRAFNQSKQMLAKINFPRESIVIGGIYEGLFNFFLRIIILLPIIYLLGGSVAATVVMLPVGLFLMVLIGITCGLLLGPLGLIFQDVERAVALALPLFMILSGVVIPFPREGFLGVIEKYNPLAIAVNSSREAMIGLPLDNLLACVISNLIMVVILLLGWMVFRVALPHAIARIPA